MPRIHYRALVLPLALRTVSCVRYACIR
ncbi:hypothetical protein Gohar_016731, partial [Gossypium harknessii]|nr:hypothetical protein [Gossypium harknessii]